MANSTLDKQTIEKLRDIPDLIPVLRDYFENWTIKLFDREKHACKNYLSPNRRDFYKILFITEGTGVFTIGVHTFSIEEPTILFIHPSEIISWKRLQSESAGHYCLFKKRFIEDHPIMKAVIEKYCLFTDLRKSVVRLPSDAVETINQLFRQMHKEVITGGLLAGDALQAYMQLIMIASTKVGDYAKPDAITDEFRHIHEFFRLLEKETANISYSNPIRIRSAKEFAARLAVHPNHLNALLKKHTGQNLSTHIKRRLLEESKVLLLQTDWTLQDIGYSIGYAEQPNFSQFFKKNIGMTPAEFRHGYMVDQNATA